MEIMIKSPLESQEDTLDRVLSPSNIRLHPQSEDPRERGKVAAYQRFAPPSGLYLHAQEQPSNPESSFQEQSSQSCQTGSTPKRREARIFSIVHKEQRENSGSHTSNSSRFKESRPGLSLVSREKKRIERSSSKQKEERSLRALESFTVTVTSHSLALSQDEKQNRPAASALKIKQPEFLKAHPLRMGKMNGSCMGKLIVQRALQDRHHCFLDPRTNPLHSRP